MDILCPQLLIVEICIQWRQLCLQNLWQHQGAHAQRGACRSEVKLGDGETQHIGEVYQLLLTIVGEVHFEAVIDPLRRGSGLIQGRLKNSVYVGHSLSFAPQQERKRRPGGLRGPPSGHRILGGVPRPLISGLLSPDQGEPVITSRGSHRGHGGRSCALQWRWRQFPPTHAPPRKSHLGGLNTIEGPPPLQSATGVCFAPCVWSQEW